MSRSKRFAHALLSGYMVLGVNILFTLASLPLALHYLSNDEFGLWVVAAQIAGYISLMDLGLSASAARILIDYKDNQKHGEYGGVIQTDVLVGLSQAGLIFLIGVPMAFVLGPLLKKVPEKLEPEFFWLIIGLCCITATMFVTRIIAHVLNANQRFDVTNYSSAAGLIVNYGVMWCGFARGGGVFSMMWGWAANVLVVLAFNWIACIRLKLFPRRGEWGRPSWARFHELFAYGRDVALYAFGWQFVNFSQTVLLTRIIGLEAAAVWSVYTKAYLLLVQLIGRIFDFSSSALVEMMVRDERDNLLRRFREIAVLNVNLAVVAGALLAVGNSAFVQVWKAGTVFLVPWPSRNDLLLAIWLVISISVRAHSGLISLSKTFRILRYLYFIEGLAFIGITILLNGFGGITMMLTVSIVCSLCFTFSYGLWRTCGYFHLSWSDLARWHRGTLALAASVAPVAVLVWWFPRNRPGIQRLMVELVLGIWAAWMFLRYGLSKSLRADIHRLAPAWVRPVLARAGFAKAEDG